MHAARSFLSRLLLVAAGLALAAPAAAHHPMGGTVPATWWQGLLSGLGHPVIEADHLVFLLAAGCAVALSRLAPRQAALLLPAYAFAGALGTLVRAPGLDLPWAELAVVLTLAAAAVGLWRQRLPAGPAAAALAAAVGFVHGYAYGEAVIGAEATPLLAYLLGLALLQCVLLGATWLVANRLASRFAPQRALVSRTLAGLVGAFAVWSGITLLA